MTQVPICFCPAGRSSGGYSSIYEPYYDSGHVLPQTYDTGNFKHMVASISLNTTITCCSASYGADHFNKSGYMNVVMPPKFATGL